MAHAQRAHALQDAFEDATGMRPRYPRSRVSLQSLQETLDRYVAAQDAVKALNAQKQGVKAEADEFARLGRIDIDDVDDVDDFDLDQPTEAGELEGEPALFLKRAKNAHRREGVVYQ